MILNLTYMFTRAKFSLMRILKHKSTLASEMEGENLFKPYRP